MKAYDARVAKEGRGEGKEALEESAMRRHIALMNASEVIVPRFVKDIVDPPDLERFRPRLVEEGRNVPEEVGSKEPDQLKVLHLGVGKTAEGAVQVLEGEAQKEREEEEAA